MTEMNLEVVDLGGAMIVTDRLTVEGGAVKNPHANVNVNVMVRHQAVMRTVTRSVIGVVVLIIEMTVSVMIVIVTIVPMMIVPVTQVQVSSEVASSVNI